MPGQCATVDSKLYMRPTSSVPCLRLPASNDQCLHVVRCVVLLVSANHKCALRAVLPAVDPLPRMPTSPSRLPRCTSRRPRCCTRTPRSGGGCMQST